MVLVERIQAARRTAPDQTPDIHHVTAGNGAAIQIGSGASGFEEQPEASRHLADPLGREGADALSQLGPVYGQDLGDVDDALSWESCLPEVQKDVARRTGAPKIRGQGADQDRPDLALVEDVVLYDHAGMTVAGF